VVSLRGTVERSQPDRRTRHLAPWAGLSRVEVVPPRGDRPAALTAGDLRIDDLSPLLDARPGDLPRLVDAVRHDRPS
jgi:hypothetical protein